MARYHVVQIPSASGQRWGVIATYNNGAQLLRFPRYETEAQAKAGMDQLSGEALMERDNPTTRSRFMSDTAYQIFQDGRTYKVRITRLGNFTQEADGFSSYADAVAWVAQAKYFAARNEEKEPISPPHLRTI